MLKKLLLIPLFLLSVGVNALTIEEVQEQFAKNDVVRATFVQKREIQNMPNPLISSGQMLMSKELGLWWHQEKPFVMTVVMTDQQLVQRVNDAAPQVITAESNPQMFQFNSLLRGIFNADLALLKKSFDIGFTDIGGGRWTLHLTPIASPFDRLFKSIELKGAKNLDQIKLFDKQGDQTQIDFMAVADAYAPITQDERACFEH